MPEDEGEALLRRRPACRGRPGHPGPGHSPSSRSAPGAASRPCTSERRPRRPAPSCSPSTTTGARRRTSPDGSTTSRIWWIPRPGRIDTLPHWRRTVSPGRARSRRSWASSGDSPTLAARWDRPSGVLLHRWRPRGGAGLGRLPGLGAARGPRRAAGHPRRVPRPGGRGAAALRALLRRPRIRRIRRRGRLRKPAGAAPGRPAG